MNNLPIQIRYSDDMPDNYLAEIQNYIDKINLVFEFVEGENEYNFMLNVITIYLHELIAISKDPPQINDAVIMSLKQMLEDRQKYET